jgi:NADPH-dependent curcumin reductase CurA
MNTRIVLANRPAEGPIPANTFKQEQKPVPKKEDLKDGEVIVRVMWLSLVCAVNLLVLTCSCDLIVT